MDAMPKYEFNKRDFPETGNTATPLFKAYVLLGNDNHLPEKPVLLLGGNSEEGKTTAST
jgi:hypothetical protein|tara:strand:+ start:6484 stop:6660 length:177 start_codon:yes stop_codon:yes gene_type:complete